MYTHVCIETAKNGTDKITPLIKKGDYCTCIEVLSDDNIAGGTGMKFKEHKGITYAARLFLPLPPQQEKSVYVAISETLKETILEPLLN